MKRFTIGSLTILMIILILPPQFSCKKIDLKREVLVLTDPAESVSANSATLLGNIVDPGEDDSFSEYGFVYSTTGDPNVDDQKIIAGTNWKTGSFSSQITGLASNTNYFFRSYVSSNDGEVYGNINSFTTSQNGGPVSEWLHYDDGSNFDGIGLNEGGSFDVAIRFTPQQLASYNGFLVTRIKFFPKIGLPVEYSVEIFEGPQPTLDDQVLEQFVEFPAIDEWNDVSLIEPHTIDATQELWVGYYIAGQDPGTFPAGIDDGPGEAGFGDMISVDNLESWISLAEADIDANWNIQVFVTNEAGEEIPMTRELPEQTRRSENPGKASGFSSSKKSVQ